MSGFRWEHWSSHSQIPWNAVRGGQDRDGSPIYVGRTQHAGDTIPVKIVPNHRKGYLPYGGKEIEVHNAEIMVQGTLQWVPSSRGNVPPNAIPVGRTRSGEQLYCARAHHEGSLCVGKLHPSHGNAYVPYGGKEHAHGNYEVLVFQ